MCHAHTHLTTVIHDDTVVEAVAAKEFFVEIHNTNNSAFSFRFSGEIYETGSHVWVWGWKMNENACFIFLTRRRKRDSLRVYLRKIKDSRFSFDGFSSHYRAGFFLCDSIRDFAMVCVRASIPFMVVLVARAGGVCGAQWPSG